MALGALVLASVCVARADVQPVPPVGARITLTGLAVAGECFDTLDNLKLSERNQDRWNGDKMDAFLAAHSVILQGGEKARVLAVYPTYPWTTNAGTDYVKPIHLAFEKVTLVVKGDWHGNSCWWEFSQNPDMLPKFTWWKQP